MTIENILSKTKDPFYIGTATATAVPVIGAYVANQNGLPYEIGAAVGAGIGAAAGLLAGAAGIGAGVALARLGALEVGIGAAVAAVAGAGGAAGVAGGAAGAGIGAVAAGGLLAGTAGIGAGIGAEYKNKKFSIKNQVFSNILSCLIIGGEAYFRTTGTISDTGLTPLLYSLPGISQMINYNLSNK